MGTTKSLRFSMVISLCFIVLLTSCKSSNSDIKIALMLNNMRIARWQKDKTYFLQETKKLGCIGIVVDADLNDQVQISQAQDLIKQGVKTLVIAAVNSTTGAAIVRLAKENGVKTISYDGLINDCPLDYSITFDNKIIGKLMAEYALSKVNEGNYMIIGGDKSNTNAVQIRDGEDEVLSPYLKNGKIQITYSSYTEGWDTEEACITMKKILKLSSESRPVAILVSNDNMAQGVITAYEEANLPLPVITGQDASLMGCRNIMLDKQSMTVYKPIQKLAAQAADLAFKAARGEKIEGAVASVNGRYNTPVIYVDILAVDKNNMKSTVVADGFEKMEDIMK